MGNLLFYRLVSYNFEFHIHQDYSNLFKVVKVFYFTEIKIKQVTQVFQVFLISDNRVQVLNTYLLLFNVVLSVLYKIKCCSFFVD